MPIYNCSNDKTIERYLIKRYLCYVKDYEKVKNKNHPTYRFVKDFYEANGLKRQLFLKFYNRFKQTGDTKSLLPQKRGPKYRTRSPIQFIINKVIKLRELGNNKYQIHALLLPILKDNTPSFSGIYNILKRAKLNILTPKIKKQKREIVKNKIGEMAHIDCHFLPKGTIKNYNKRLYIVGLIDDCSRLILMEIVEDIKALTVMFATLKMLNIFAAHYDIKFAEVLSDNGKEFGIKNSKSKDNHPFEYMLKTMGIKHRYTRPYRPQTNGKIERFWRTLKDDLLEDYQFESIEDLKEELLQYNYYYNHERPHQALNGKSPFKFSENCEKIS